MAGHSSTRHPLGSFTYLYIQGERLTIKLSIQVLNSQFFKSFLFKKQKRFGYTFLN